MSARPIVVVGRLSPQRAEVLLPRARVAEPTYDDIGSTLAGTSDPDFSVARPLGTGRETFDRARAALRAFVPQRAVASVLPEDAVAVEGATVLIALRLGPITVVAPDRIVAVVDEADRWGFAYGTLPGHPERGEEAFEVLARPDGSVLARVAVSARPALPASSLLAPVVERVSRHYAGRYLDALQAVILDGDEYPPP